MEPAKSSTCIAGEGQVPTEASHVGNTVATRNRSFPSDSCFRHSLNVPGLSGLHMIATESDVFGCRVTTATADRFPPTVPACVTDRKLSARGLRRLLPMRPILGQTACRKPLTLPAPGTMHRGQ